MVPRLVTLTDL